MSRFYIGFSILFIIVLASSQGIAQQTASVNDEYGRRAAKIPQSPADTGILFDEYRLEQASHDYFNSARFSGTNVGKTMHQIESESYDAIRGMQNTVSFKSQSSSAWVPIAGSQDGHASGRIRAVAFDPTSLNTVYIGAASGGIWKTLDITSNPVQWINLSDRLPTCNFGALAVDPKRPNIVYAGTGESQGDNYREQISPSSSQGSGLFRSKDGGLNWDTVATTALEGAVCSQIVIDPVNTDTVYVASDNGSGILKSTDGGTTWKKITVGVSPLSIAIDPVNTNNLYTSGFGSIYRSTNYGEAWTKCVTGLPTNGGRITIAIAPSATNTIYASIGVGTVTLGVWVSDDFGVTWRKQFQYNSALPDGTKNKNPLGSQEQWCNSIVVHPTNAARIFVAGLDIYSSSDSGKDLTAISDWTQQVNSNRFVHADQHFLVFNGNTLYACTDGGLAKTSDFSTWNTAINKGIATLQFVGVDADKDFTYVTGGCQDNSTNHALIGDAEFHATIGGDGGHGWVSQQQSTVAYTTYVYTNFKQSLDGANNWDQTNLLASNTLLYNPSNNGAYPGEGSPFYTVYDCSLDGSIVALGGNRHVWVSTAGGQDGFPNESNVGIGSSFAIHVAPADPSGSIIWAASGGNIFRTFDQGTTWVKQTSSLSSTITGITSNPNDASKVFACATGGKHFFVSSDSGKTFTTPATNFPNIPCWAIAVHPTDGRLFIGTEKGVLWSNDNGVTWYPVMTGLPYVMVTQLKVRGTNDDKLLAGTYGRGMFWLDLTTLGVKPAVTGSEPLTLEPTYPNPITSQTATMGFDLQDAGVATITLNDLLGRELRILEKSYFDAGRHQISFTTTGLPSGTYFVLLTENGKSVSQKIVVE